MATPGTRPEDRGRGGGKGEEEDQQSKEVELKDKEIEEGISEIYDRQKSSQNITGDTGHLPILSASPATRKPTAYPPPLATSPSATSLSYLPAILVSSLPTMYP